MSLSTKRKAAESKAETKTPSKRAKQNSTRVNTPLPSGSPKKNFVIKLNGPPSNISIDSYINPTAMGLFSEVKVHIEHFLTCLILFRHMRNFAKRLVFSGSVIRHMLMECRSTKSMNFLDSLATLVIKSGIMTMHVGLHGKRSMMQWWIFMFKR